MSESYAGKPHHMIPICEIQRIVAQHYGISKADFLGQRKIRAVVRPRHIAMYLAREMTTRSFPIIGNCFRGRDHTTVLHACRAIKKLMLESETLAADVVLLRERITAFALERQAQLDDPAFDAIAPVTELVTEIIPQPAPSPPEPVKAPKRVRLSAYGPRAPAPSPEPVRPEHYVPGGPLPSAFPEAA